MEGWKKHKWNEELLEEDDTTWIEASDNGPETVEVKPRLKTNVVALPLNARLSSNSLDNYSIKIHEKSRIKKSGFNPIYRIYYYVQTE